MYYSVSITQIIAAVSLTGILHIAAGPAILNPRNKRWERFMVSVMVYGVSLFLTLIIYSW